MRVFGIMWSSVMSDTAEKRIFDLDLQINNLEGLAKVLLHVSASAHLNEDEQVTISWLAGALFAEVREMRKCLDR